MRLNRLEKWQQADFVCNIDAYRGGMWALFIFLVLWSGIRFSDGTVLLAIARGMHPDDPSLKGFGQYLWDAPLKVWLLQTLPAKIIAIGLAFAILGVLPGLGMLSRNRGILWLTVVTVFLTPAFKVSIENLGVGDGATLFLILCISSSTNRPIIFGATLLAALWHPHQSFFIGVSYFVGKSCYDKKPERRDMLAVAGGLASGAGGFLIYKHSLPFVFAGRGDFLVQHGGDTLVRNLCWSPVAFAPVILWLLVLAPRPERCAWLLFGWLCALGAIAVFTTDVTRVMTITSLPIVLAGANKIADGQAFRSAARVAATAIAIILLPPLNWSGFDYFLWPDLIGDLCKWQLYCKI